MARNAPRSTEVFRRRLREAREARGWTQEKLAREAGMYATVVTKLEKGGEHGRQDVTLDELVELAVALNVSPVALFLPVDDAEVTVGGDTRDAAAVRDHTLGRHPLDVSSVDAVRVYLEEGFPGTKVRGGDLPDEVRGWLEAQRRRWLEASGIGVEEVE